MITISSFPPAIQPALEPYRNSVSDLATAVLEITNNYNRALEYPEVVMLETDPTAALVFAHSAFAIAYCEYSIRDIMDSVYGS